ncbi:MAG: DNA-processing protein DprA [Rhizobiaceae bacterium]
MSPLPPSSVGIELSDQQRLAWLRLIRSEKIGAATFIELIKRFGTASDALEALPELTARSGSPPITVTSEQRAMAEMDRIQGIGGKLICLGEPDYPAALRATDMPPPVLTVRGDSSALRRHAIAIVGSRNASLAGIKLTERLVRDIVAASANADAAYVIVSGLARGIDAAAHRASLKSGTIAVFAGGVDHIYPHDHVELANGIVDQGGAIISEMPFGWQPRAQDFPRRNRIVAGLALGLVVVEAARRSGSLISARLANELGRLVFAVPGSPLDPRSEGTNDLIKQGAQLITSAGDIVKAIDPIAAMPTQSDYSLDEMRQSDMIIETSNQQRQQLLNAMGYTPVAIDDLIRHTGLSADLVQMIILELDLAGIIERHAGNRVSRI